MPSNIEVAFGPLVKFTTEKVKKILLGVAANLTEVTPVDTGHAANNWVPSVAAPYDGTSGSPDFPDSSAQAAGIQAVLATYELPQVGWVSNNVPYIGALNDGHSQQAPAGFVQAGVLKAIREVAQE